MSSQVLSKYVDLEVPGYITKLLSSDIRTSCVFQSEVDAIVANELHSLQGSGLPFDFRIQQFRRYDGVQRSVRNWKMKKSWDSSAANLYIENLIFKRFCSCDRNASDV